MSDAEQEGLALHGLDGTNPLGFLAALGLLRVLGEHTPESEPRLRWEMAGMTWTPRLLGQAPWAEDGEALVAFLTQRLSVEYEVHPIAVALAANGDDNRRDAHEAAIKQGNAAFWLASVGSEAVDADTTSQLQTVRRDYFVGNVQSLLANTTPDHLRRSLLRSWDMADPLDNHSLHLNPSEDRRHAHQWSKPSGDPDRKHCGGMIGANRLALEAWPLFPLIPCDGTARTLGFTGTRSNNTRWTWPLWSFPTSLATVNSLLCVPDLQAEAVPQNLKPLGVVAVYRTRRILVGKTPNFTPAERVA